MSLKLFVAFIISFGIISCSHFGRFPAAKDFPSETLNANSKNLYEYDSGPSKSSRWPNLFADTPNYRAFGDAILEGRGEKFRWKFGPMWYRGRLEKNKVKIFVIGQEGAQDENVSNRSFTGSTGTKMQKFLNHFGITESYLFMNTFVYTITGQYTLYDSKKKEDIINNRRLLWIAQSKNSEVVKHRHRLFDEVLDTNKDLNLIIGVGTAGKDSAANFANYLVKNNACTNSKMTRKGGYCEVNYKGRKIYFIGVPHPGAASARNGGSSAVGRLKSSFNDKASTVLRLIESKKLDLSLDKGGKRKKSSDKYVYGNAEIPRKDFAFGTNWRMGKSGTTSNRRGSDTIQIFSSDGCYNNAKVINGRCSQTKSQSVSYSTAHVKTNTKAVPKLSSREVPYESPKVKNKEYDYGPDGLSSNLIHSKKLVDFFLNLKSTWESEGYQHLSLGPNGLYRGTFNNPETIIIADQFSNTDMFSGRALTGEVGQKLQHYLEKKGIENYLILRTLPVDTLKMNYSDRRKLSLSSKVVSERKKLLDHVKAKSKDIIVVGDIALDVAKKYLGSSSKVDVFDHENYSNMAIIPRSDLPVHTRYWMGTSGNRATEGYSSSNKDVLGNYYRVFAPTWATRWKKGELNKSEKSSISSFSKDKTTVDSGKWKMFNQY